MYEGKQACALIRVPHLYVLLRLFHILLSETDTTQYPKG